jgi:adenosylmethionine-8-amino-7-oxononanoate aminotransferase
MSIQYFTELPVPQPQRVNIISRKSSYHGNTLGSLAVGHHTSRRRIYESLLSKNVHHISQCYPYRGMKTNERVEDYVVRLAQELEDEFQRLGPDTVCAFVAETMTGAVRTSLFSSCCLHSLTCLNRHSAVCPRCQAISKQ